MSGSAAKQSSDERTMIRDGGVAARGRALRQTNLRQQMRNAPMHIHILGHRKHRRFGMMRDQHPKKFFDRIFPSRTEASEARRAEIENARVGADGPSPAPGVATRSSHLIADKCRRRQRARSQAGKSRRDGPEAGQAPPHGARGQTVRRARSRKGRGASSPPKAPNVG